MKFLHYKITVLLFLIWSCAIAQDHIQFRNYTISDGLSQSVIYCIAQDNLSALWLGTQDGINRFNGKSFEVFTSDGGYDISSGYILSTLVDSKGDVWFGTYDGLVRYQPYLEKFTSFTLPTNRRLEIRSIANDGDGNLWLGTAFGNIYKFNKSSEQFTLIDSKTFESNIAGIEFLKDKVYVLSEYEGLLITNKDFSQKQVVGYNSTFQSLELTANKLIIGPSNTVIIAASKGLFYFDERTGKLKPYRQNVLFNLGEINVVDVLFLSDNRFFLASENSGLFQVTISDTLEITNYAGDEFQKGSLLSDKLKALYRDRHGIIWIASQRGLSSFDPDNIGFRGVGLSNNPSRGLVSQNVWGFDEDPQAKYLFIAGDHGVTRFDKRNHMYNHYFRKSPTNEDVTVLGIHVISSTEVLVGSFDGLYRLKIDPRDADKYEYIPIPHKGEDYRGFEKNYIILPYKDGDHYLIGTRAGLAIMNSKTSEFNYFFHNPSDSLSLSPGPCRLVFESNDNRYYVVPSSGKIHEVEQLADGTFRVFRAKRFEQLDRSTKDYFTCMVQTSNDEFWFGTMGDGLFYFNEKTKEIQQFNKTNGLPNNVIYGIERNIDKSKIWMSTNRGLASYDLRLKEFQTYSEEDGLMSNELNLGACFASVTGELYFGGIQGYNYFDPQQRLVRISNLSVVLWRLDIENERILPGVGDYITEGIAFAKVISLPYRHKGLNLYFYADNLSFPERTEYKYILSSGSEDIEEFLGQTNMLRFTSLSPGEYKLSLYARHSGGEWSTTPTELIIRVERPYWLTWWFYSLVGLFVGFLIFRAVRKSIDKERREQVRLELKIAERTKEIREKTREIELQKEKLEEQKRELENEKEKSERLLSNLLPKETANQLKDFGKSAARDFSMVSVMFTDFVGFSSIAESMKAKDLVSVLDRYFRKFDEVIEKHTLEKIKTIGDAYMCAGGVPIRDKTNPINTVLAALEIQHLMSTEREIAKAKGEHQWELRIGINTGAVSAGVIGTKRLAYDVWGRTVNRAERMESLCPPNQIAISEATFDYIEPYFECEAKGKVLAKGGMEITMYIVKSIKPELSIDGKGVFPNEAFHKLVDLHFYSQINYYKAERFILNRLKNELSPKLHYHSYDHSKDVTRQAERIAIGEGITDEDLFLLKTAATYHDAGFVKQYEKNEPIGAEMAQEILPNFGYTQAHIDRIKDLIFVTQIPHNPKDILEMIMCDADLDYLGRDDFFEIADSLRRELREHGKIDSDRKWDEIQVNFLTQHRYFTKTSIESRRPKKLENLEAVKARLERNEYKD
jgi:class 3 adenylate cyclase/ligand-binding sensor domain-containing protein/predicted metal-dependent HD superfamily phosphohydrolase